MPNDHANDEIEAIRKRLTTEQRQQLQALSQPSTSRFLSLVLIDWLIIAGAMWVAHWSGFQFAVTALALLVIGNRQHALFAMGHEGSHGTVSRNSWLNDTITRVFCLSPMTIPLAGYRKFHHVHHRETGTLLDTELPHKRKFQEWALPLRPIQQLRYILTSLLGGSALHLGFITLMVRPLNLRDALVGTVAFWGAVVAVCGYFGTWWIVLLWWGSALTGMWLAFRLRIWLEHVGTRGTHRVRATFWQRLLFAPHVTDLHWEHHLWPAAPAWNLQKVRDMFAEPRIVSTAELFAWYRQAPPLASGEFYPPDASQAR